MSWAEMAPEVVDTLLAQGWRYGETLGEFRVRESALALVRTCECGATATGKQNSVTHKPGCKRSMSEAKTVYAPRKLDIACGQNLTPGFTGIDIAGDAKIKHDLFQFPWPIKTGSVREIVCNHFVEHIPHDIGAGKDGFFAFFEEVHRICRKGATISIVHPFSRSDRAFWDPTHHRYISDTTWYYLSAEWRTLQRLDHYSTTADFEVITINGIGIPDEVMMRSEQQRAMQMAHYWNVIADLQVVLRRV